MARFVCLRRTADNTLAVHDQRIAPFQHSRRVEGRQPRLCPVDAFLGTRHALVHRRIQPHAGQLSGTINAMRSARENLLEKFPERTFIIVDTLSISGPQTLLVLKAHEMYRAGESIETVAQWVEDNKLRAQAFFTVDDLKYLQRGGRVSATAAALGTLLDLKPILTETREGKLAAAQKVRGRKKALGYMVDKAAECIEDPAESIVLVLHADAKEDAAKVAIMLHDRIPNVRVRIENVGPVIGAHAGPGTVAVCFIGKERTM